MKYISRRGYELWHAGIELVEKNEGGGNEEAN